LFVAGIVIVRRIGAAVMSQRTHIEPWITKLATLSRQELIARIENLERGKQEKAERMRMRKEGNTDFGFSGIFDHLTDSGSELRACKKALAKLSPATYKERIEDQRNELQRKEVNRAKVTRECDYKIASAESAVSKTERTLAREIASLQAARQAKKKKCR
jgi:hypothetical protein